MRFIKEGGSPVTLDEFGFELPENVVTKVQNIIGALDLPIQSVRLAGDPVRVSDLWPEISQQIPVNETTKVEVCLDIGPSHAQLILTDSFNGDEVARFDGHCVHQEKRIHRIIERAYAPITDEMNISEVFVYPDNKLWVGAESFIECMHTPTSGEVSMSFNDLAVPDNLREHVIVKDTYNAYGVSIKKQDYGADTQIVTKVYHGSGSCSYILGTLEEGDDF